MIRKKKELSFEVDQMYEGMLITVKEGDRLDLICCDCLMCHAIKIKILGTVKGKRKIVLDMRRDVEATNELRSHGSTEIEDGYKVKVTKVYNTKTEK
jgi:hypothetical protein